MPEKVNERQMQEKCMKVGLGREDALHQSE